MNRPAPKPPLMSLNDSEERLADQPDDERWGLLAGCIVRMMVDPRWEHNTIAQISGAACVRGSAQVDRLTAP